MKIILDDGEMLKCISVCKAKVTVKMIAKHVQRWIWRKEDTDRRTDGRTHRQINELYLTSWTKSHTWVLYYIEATTIIRAMWLKLHVVLVVCPSVRTSVSLYACWSLDLYWGHSRLLTDQLPSYNRIWTLFMYEFMCVCVWNRMYVCISF